MNKISKTIIQFLATCAYTGKLPKAPGTWGSLLALIPLIFLNFTTFHKIIITLIIIITGIIVSSLAEKKIYNSKDPGEIVIDEFAGMFISLVNIPFNTNWQTIVLYSFAFISFRYLDIAKPGIINRLQNFSGGVGIMLDDIAAGLFTLLFVNILQYFIFLL